MFVRTSVPRVKYVPVLPIRWTGRGRCMCMHLFVFFIVFYKCVTLYICVFVLVFVFACVSECEQAVL